MAREQLPFSRPSRPWWGACGRETLPPGCQVAALGEQAAQCCWPRHGVLAGPTVFQAGRAPEAAGAVSFGSRPLEGFPCVTPDGVGTSKPQWGAARRLACLQCVFLGDPPWSMPGDQRGAPTWCLELWLLGSKDSVGPCSGGSRGFSLERRQAMLFPPSVASTRTLDSKRKVLRQKQGGQELSNLLGHFWEKAPQLGVGP